MHYSCKSCNSPLTLSHIVQRLWLIWSIGLHRCSPVLSSAALVHPAEPLSGVRHRPLLQRNRFARPGAAPAPWLGSFDEVCAYRIPFDVATDRETILARFDGKRLNPSLMHRPCSHGMPILMPPLQMREGEPMHEARAHAVVSWQTTRALRALPWDALLNWQHTQSASHAPRG